MEVGVKAIVATFMRHVAGGINVDEPDDAGHYQHHDHSELVHLEIEARVEIPGGDPGEIRLHPGYFCWTKLEKFADGFERAEKREPRRADDGDGDVFIRPLRAKKPVDRRTEQRQERHDPQLLEPPIRWHQSFGRHTRSTLTVS